MLLTNHHAPDPRVAAEIETLRGDGVGVRLVCWDRDRRGPARETADGLEIERVHVRSTHRRGAAQAWFVARYWAAAVARGLRGRVDWVHAHDLDTWPAGWLIARLRGVPLILDVHDSFHDMMHGHLSPGLCRAIRWLENRMLRRADAVVTIGRQLAEELARRGARRLCVLPNCKRPADYALPQPQRDEWRARMDIRPDQWCLGYISHLGCERPVPAMIEAVAADPRVVWVVGGSGYHAQTVARAAKRHPNIRYLGEAPPRDVPRLTACFDALFCGYDPANPNARFSAPNKLFEALAAGRPLLGGMYGEVGRIIAEHGCGVAVERFDPTMLRGALDRLADADFRAAAGRRAALLGREQFDWDRVRRRLTELYATLDAGRNLLSETSSA
jgi:glycosyltransferase involved in cell wall biosynthesis